MSIAAAPQAPVRSPDRATETQTRLTAVPAPLPGTFAPRLPFDNDRKGALAGILDRIDGPLTAVHSRHDGAVGTFYPLASMTAREDSAGIGDANSRWGGIGANGAQGVQARDDAIRGAGPGNVYPFTAQRALNVDASDVVRTGGPPSGAHSDIVHPELTWIVLTAGRIVG